MTGPDNETFGPGVAPTWTLAAADATTAVTVRCSVVPAGQPRDLRQLHERHARSGWSTPPDGRYTLTVRATDAAGNFVEQTRAFAVDTGPPDTTITSGPETARAPRLGAHVGLAVERAGIDVRVPRVPDRARPGRVRAVLLCRIA